MSSHQCKIWVYIILFYWASLSLSSLHTFFSVTSGHHSASLPTKMGQKSLNAEGTSDEDERLASFLSEYKNLLSTERKTIRLVVAFVACTRERESERERGGVECK